MGSPDFKLEATEVWGDENMVEEVGVYTFNDANGTTLDKGKYICLWKMEDGKWKIYRDIFNSDMPAPPPPPQPKK